MKDNLKNLESRRESLFRKLEGVGDFRRGTIAVNYRKCGKKNCVCAQVALGHADIEELAGIRIDTKEVERCSNESGRQVEVFNHQEREIALSGKIVPIKNIPIMYICADGTGVPVVKEDVVGRKGKGEGGIARTREAKLGCVFTQTTLDEKGYPVRDEGSTTYVGAIETAEVFADRIYGEAVRRGMNRAQKVCILGDGAPWIWNIADEQFYGATQITDDKATKSDLVAYSEDWLKRRVNRDSTVYVYYAGHGAPDPQGADAFIVPYEGHPDFPSKLYSLKSMYESLNQLPARDVIVMLDSCFSGAKGRSVTSRGARPMVVSMENPLLSGGRITVLAAATGSQISSDYDPVQHGLFTYYLLRGLRGEADDDEDGLVSLGELYGYVRANVAETASLKLNRDQTPIILPSAVTAGERLDLPVTRVR